MLAIITIFLISNSFFRFNTLCVVFLYINYLNFLNSSCTTSFYFRSSRYRSWDQMKKNQKSSKKMMILQRFSSDKSTILSNQKIDFANSFFSIKFSVKLNVIMISIVAFNFLFKRNYKNKSYDFFFMFLYDINKIMNYIEFRINIRSMFKMKKSFAQKITLEKINRFLSMKFKNLL